MVKNKMDIIPTPYYKVPEVPEYLLKMPDRISENLNHKTIFLSGGSGFLGRVLIEKILRKSTEVKRIYVLMRAKKGKDPRQRFDDLFSSPLFDHLKSLRGPEVFKKVSVISGDVMEPGGMGISAEDREILCNTVEVVFHSAATIRFDEPLRKCVLLNTRGTKQMLELGNNMKNLKLFCHISTAYCHLQEKVLEEKTYPPAADPHKIIKSCELLDEELIEAISKKILKGFPNTYAFTKNLSEGLVQEFMAKGMPCLIVRPSVVIPMWLEPLPGWTDNINGPTGLLIGAGKGIIRTTYCNNNAYADYFPVDICINAILIASWDFMSNKEKNTNVFNITSSSEWQITWQEVIDLGRDVINDIPLNNAVWYPGGSMKKNKLHHQICVILFHLIPAYFLDTIIYLSGNKPLLVRIQERISKGFESFEYYCNNQWEFRNDYLRILRGHLNERESIEYKIDGIGMNIRNYFSDCILSARLYILKETPDTIPAARRHMRIMWWVDKATKLLLIGLILWFFSSWSGPFINLFYTIFYFVGHVLSYITSDSSVEPLKNEL